MEIMRPSANRSSTQPVSMLNSQLLIFFVIVLLILFLLSIFLFAQLIVPYHPTLSRRECRLTTDTRKFEGVYTPETAWQRGWQTSIPFVRPFSFRRAYTQSLRSDIPEFEACITAVRNWSEYILNSFDVPYSNGFTGGCNNKTKVLKRVCFGVRSFPTFRNRILHCAS